MEALCQVDPEDRRPRGMYLAKNRRLRKLTSLVKIWGRFLTQRIFANYTFTLCICITPTYKENKENRLKDLLRLYKPLNLKNSIDEFHGGERTSSEL